MEMLKTASSRLTSIVAYFSSADYPYLEHNIMQSYDIPTVANIMSRYVKASFDLFAPCSVPHFVLFSPVVTVNDIEAAGTLETILRENAWSAFPVVNMTTKEYIGVIRR
jgi:hypothetical protein